MEGDSYRKCVFLPSYSVEEGLWEEASVSRWVGIVWGQRSDFLCELLSGCIGDVMESKSDND